MKWIADTGAEFIIGIMVGGFAFVYLWFKGKKK